MNRWKSRLLTGLLAAVLCVTLAPSTLALSAYDRPGQKLVALTFDDGPCENTARILDILKAHNAKATFFMIGHKVPDNPSIVRRVMNEGHQVGNHTYSHPHLSTLTNAEIEKEVQDGVEVLSQYTGLGPRFYLRPPYASYTTHVANVGAVPIMWCSMDTEDWLIDDADKLLAEVMDNVKDGDVLIMHDTVESTADALDRILTALECEGYTMVTVEDLFWRRGITVHSGQIYYSAPAGNEGVNRCEEAIWFDESQLSSFWAWDAICWAMDNGYMNVNEYGEFTPKFPLTRGMFVTILGRLSGVTADAVSSGFRDIPDSHYAAPYAAWARENGIMIGVGSNLFGVDSPLTRQEMAVTLARYIQSRMPADTAAETSPLTYTDSASIASWAKEGVAYCSDVGILKGEEGGKFAPEQTTNRAMGATILQRLAAYPFPDAPSNPAVPDDQPSETAVPDDSSAVSGSPDTGAAAMDPLSSETAAPDDSSAVSGSPDTAPADPH